MCDHSELYQMAWDYAFLYSVTFALGDTHVHRAFATWYANIYAGDPDAWTPSMVELAWERYCGTERDDTP